MAGHGKSVDKAQKDVRALQMRAQGFTYDQIAQALGDSNRGIAYRRVWRHLEEQQAESADMLRTQAMMRYETILRHALLVVTQQKKTTELTDEGVTEKAEYVYAASDRMAASNTIRRTQDSINRLMGLNLEPEPQMNVTNHQTLILESSVLSNAMREAITGEEPLDLGEVIDVDVDDEDEE